MKALTTVIQSVRIMEEGQTMGEVLDVERVHGTIYRLLMSPLIVGTREEPALAFGDIAELRPVAPDVFTYVRRIMLGAYRHFTWAMPRGFRNGERFERFSRRLHEAGGEWEVIAGGIFKVHVPLDSAFDADAEVERLARQDADGMAGDDVASWIRRGS